MRCCFSLKMSECPSDLTDTCHKNSVPSFLRHWFFAGPAWPSVLMCCTVSFNLLVCTAMHLLMDLIVCVDDVAANVCQSTCMRWRL
ncbi:uncharacterized protein K489DRAFT_139493 [Dissoconium aciculare CBS 342.82]|uniref:Uncharacterized protein n=1 Tax=Dissoconium aciculare CBS 342.82 TaxID=1314786 RepID=A0A6J3LQE9_9PEZI|nr:uncharacterized protein K489DRAFT_139493 [Dissoconium aciculare CBS 342.82]KAF1817863.1 hypothetical protein K489DRAFT_139493 [Dissoconium aciculare CBS 342.82]